MAPGPGLTAETYSPYRQRLRREGGALAASGLVGSVLLLTVSDESTRHSASTIGQLAVVAILLAVVGPLMARRAMDNARPIAGDEAGDGRPTALWKLPLIVAVLAGVVGAVAGWDAGLRVTGGCLLVGLAQALLVERIVAARERRTGERFVRVGGSSVLRGTRLGRVEAR